VKRGPDPPPPTPKHPRVGLGRFSFGVESGPDPGLPTYVCVPPAEQTTRTTPNGSGNAVVDGKFLAPNLDCPLLRATRRLKSYSSAAGKSLSALVGAALDVQLHHKGEKLVRQGRWRLKSVSEFLADGCPKRAKTQALIPSVMFTKFGQIKPFLGHCHK
jgi:hypothetical protein